MLTVTIEGDEGFNQETQEFVMTSETVVLQLEHSLLSVSKWESKYQKPFLSSGMETTDEIFDYLRAMVVTPGGDLDALFRCNGTTIARIQEYIDSSQSATTFGEMPPMRRGPKRVITSELIYYWMVAFNIPFSPCESWHLNRLFSLIRIANLERQPPKKMSRGEIARRNAEINRKRREELGTSG